MSKLDLVKGREIYSNTQAGVCVYEGTVNSGKVRVAVKERKHTTLAAANSSIGEALSQVRLRHPHICHIYECYLQPHNGNYLTVLIMDLYSRDLHQEITQRSQARRTWSESELINFLVQLVSALSFMQENGIAHRDIKPQNIFLQDDELKIGDFGSAHREQSVYASVGSVQGSPFFLSPELKRQYEKSGISEKLPDSHNPYKSDMYSLGMTLVYAMMLGPPIRLSNLSQLVENTQLEVALLPVSQKLKDVVKLMLRVEQEDRPDFLQLRKVVLTSFPEAKAVERGEREGVVPFAPIPPSDSEHESPTMCIQCNSDLLDMSWASAVPAYLQVHRKYFSVICSLRCLQAFNLLATTNTDRCIDCGCALSLSPAKLLCGHLFHDIDCFVHYLIITHSGRLREESIIKCPVCNAEGSFFNTIRVNPEQDIVRRIESAKRSICSKCWERAAIYKFRGCRDHYFCGSCVPAKPGVFSWCPKCSESR